MTGSGGTAGNPGSSGTGATGGTAGAGAAGAAGNPGIGGSSGLAGASGTAGAPGAVCLPPPPGLDTIDDMDDGDRFILPGRGRSGAWKTGGDGTPGATMSPAPGGNFTMTDTGDPCRELAAYVKGFGYALDGASFSVGLGSPYNASAYRNLTFWAKVDPGTTPRLRVSLPDKDTHPDGGICQWSGQNLCWDHYGLRVAFTTAWAQYTIPFSSLTQNGWGNLGAAFDPASVYEVVFEIPVNANFGIWIDDLAFLP
jgi:Carbohydrate binding domain (family 11).